jgi:3'-phosphoadenosine 5'-phosphosulfate sulfotransferase (PAPS reductase)/FAD synthetase
MKLTHNSETPIVVVSLSGGKDSVATYLLARERNAPQHVFPAFADTGNEHEVVYEYLGYLEEKLRTPIKRLKVDFTARWWRRRDYVRDKWPEKGVPPDVVTRALSILERGPTGNPFLDLCMIKGRFPSRMAQFCTQELKSFPLTAYCNEMVGQYGFVESWQGIRAEESPMRATYPERETNGEAFTIVRPILKWTVEQVFAQHRKHGIKPNPLYTMGMGRVGCVPCINCGKNELFEISRRFPEHLKRISEWEEILAKGSKRGLATFFPAVKADGSELTNEDVSLAKHGVMAVAEWSKTSYGGKQYDMLKVFDDEPPVCASAYGLCE